MGALGAQEFVLLAAMLLLGCLPLPLMVWAIVDCMGRDFPGPNDKLIWILVIVLVSCVGPLIYLIVGRQAGTPRHPPVP